MATGLAEWIRWPTLDHRGGKGESVSATQLLTLLFNAGVAVSVLATVLSLGMTFTIRQLVAPLRRIVVVLAIVVLNVVVIPAIAWGLAALSPMDDKYVPGLVLAAVGTGSAGSLKAAQLTRRADLPLGVAVVILLQLVNIAAVPIWAGQVVTGATISAWDIVKNLLVLVLLPLGIGLIIRARYAEHADRWQNDLVKVANVALAIAFTTGIAGNWSTLVNMFGSWVFVIALLIVLIAGGLGLLVGLRNAEVRTVAGFVSGMRFTSLGLIIIGTQLDGDPTYLAPAITFALVDFVVPLAVAVEIGHRARPNTAA